ncbi:MAG: methylated-DNA--[protein]-cysteine S-methyltransferase [Oscillospiraceae bacterium]|jgi:methylated-DNA-[protein]-cysteine S-methyltransferase|nr:methylated-DNA--[protein]-cysteine S-methyltransferase [Oscillospiraceae bacterium]
MTARIATPLGTAILTSAGGALTRLVFDDYASPDTTPPADELLRVATTQLAEYFAGTRQSFTLPLAPVGTVFQQKVWAAMRAIPYGQTASYAQLAQNIGHPKAVRAVGSACGKNPLVIFIPCHRVVRTDGGLGGFSSGLERKKSLHNIENISIRRPS